MKTRIPQSIRSEETAKRFIDKLVKNGEVFHFEDDAFDIVDAKGEYVFNENEARRMNLAISKMYDIEGFDPCEYFIKNHKIQVDE